MVEHIDIAPAELEASIAERARAANASIVVLPVREVDGVGIYPQDTLTLGKRLRSEGMRAVYLHDPERRRFVVQKSAVTNAETALLIGIASDAAWEAIKALFQRRKSSRVEVTYLDLKAAGAEGTAWKVVGEAEGVLKAIDSIRSERSESADEKPSSRMGPASEANFETAGPDDDLRRGHVRSMIAERRRAAEDLRAAAERAVDGDPPDMDAAERQARQALRFYARSLDWAEDTEMEDEAHRIMDAAGAWVRSTFGCWLMRKGETYQQICPVALAHNRIGFSVAGSATRVCSLCGHDLSECEHMTGIAYKVPGGAADLGWCRVCLKDTCKHDPAQLYRVSVVSIIQEMKVDEISVVTKPAQPEARVAQMDISISKLKAGLGDGFVPGMEVSCDKCLRPCGGLIKHESLGR